MTYFDVAFAEIVIKEGGYSDDKRDSGGKTNWGVTEVVARANGFVGDMRNLQQAEAKKIYKSQYWDILRLDDISIISADVAHEMFDTSVNMGAGIAGKFLQRALNVLNLGASLFPDITVDGLVGPVSVAALRKFIAHRGTLGQTVIVKALNAQQGVRYIEIAENAPKNEAFEFGWMANRL